MKALHIDMPQFNKKLIGKVYESWEEMPWQMITHVLRVFDAPIPQWWGEQARHWQNIQILKALNNWKDEDLTQWRQATLLTHQDLSFEEAHVIWLHDLNTVLTASLEFAMTEIGEGKRIMNQTLYKNPMPVIKVKDHRLGEHIKWLSAYSDYDEPFRDCTLYELGRIYTLYEQFRETGDNYYFCELLAVLYRPEKKRAERQNDDSDDPRQKLEMSNKKMRVRAAIARDEILPSVKKTMELHLVSAMARFSELYPSVFKGTAQKGKRQGDFLDFVLELADFDPVKSDEIFKRSAHDMFELAERSLARQAENTPK